MDAGLRIGPYELVRRIGAGGMGVVWEARDTRLGRGVALKFIQAVGADVESRNRFQREAQAASALTHPNICVLYDVGDHQGQPYLVMELLAGETLQERIATGPLPASQLRQLATHLARALTAAHDRGILHRDLKPANVFMTDGDTAKVLDFGLAKFSATGVGEADTELTAAGTLMGTAKYMSPEQALGRELDARSDLFSLGALLYEAATGDAPFRGPGAGAVLNAVINEQPRSLADVAAGLGPELRAAIERLLAKSPADRYASAADLLEFLQKPTNPSAPGSQARTADESATPSIAVLPFANLGGGEDNEFFSDGLAEELIIGLSRLPGLRVAARSSAFQFKGQAVDARAAGRALDVRTVLEGSVRRAGGRVRVTAQLVDVSSGYQVWADRFDGTLEDIFEIQDRMAAAIIDGLEVKLGTSGPQGVMRRHTASREAYDLYLKGRFHWSRRHKGAQQQALECFQRAVGVDPGYTLAWLGVADAYWSMCVYGVIPYDVGHARAERALERATALDPDLSEVHATRATMRWMLRRCDEGEAGYRLAIARDPKNWFPHAYLAMLLAALLRNDEARELAERAVQLEPEYHYAWATAAMSYHFAGDWEGAIRTATRGLALDEASVLNYLARGLSYTEIGEHERAIQDLRTAVDVSDRTALCVGLLGHCLGNGGQVDEARQLIAELERRREVEHVADMCLYAAYSGVDPERSRAALVAEAEAGGWGWTAALGKRPFPDVLALFGIPPR